MGECTSTTSFKTETDGRRVVDCDRGQTSGLTGRSLTATDVLAQRELPHSEGEGCPGRERTWAFRESQSSEV